MSERIPISDRVTIYARGKKKIYVADFYFDGRHCRQSLKTANRKFAADKAMEIHLRLTQGDFRNAPAAHTLESAVASYLDCLATEGRARKTLVKYRGIYDIFLGFLAENQIRHLHQCSLVWFDKFRSARKKIRHQKTLYTEGVVIKQLFKWAKTRRLIAENPLLDARLSRPPLVSKPGPSLAQVDRILAALDERRLPMVAILAFTGMRAGELQRLVPADLDLDGNWLHVVSRDGLETKTRTSRRVPLHPRLRDILKKLSPGASDRWLFAMPPSVQYPAGDHWVNIKKLNEDVQTVVEKLGLPIGRDEGITLHSFRHFFETLTVNAQIPQRVIDAWLGHHSDRSMGAVYYRLSDEDSQNFMAKVPFGTFPADPAANG